MSAENETQFILRLPSELHAQLVKLAQAKHLSLQSLLVAIAREAIEKRDTESRQDVMDHWDEGQQPPS